MRLLIFTSLSLLAFSCKQKGRASDLYSQQKFTEMFIEALAAKNKSVKYLQRDSQKIVGLYNGDSSIINTGNAYAEYLKKPEMFTITFLNYVNSLSEFNDSNVPINKNKIVAVIKDTAYIREITDASKTDRKTKNLMQLVYQKFNKELVVLFAEDSDGSIRYFTDERLKESGLIKDSLLPIDQINLKEKLHQLEITKRGNYYSVSLDDSYETSLLLIKEIWNKGNFPVKGDIVIAIPARGKLLVTGSHDSEGIASVKKMATELFNSETYYLLPDLFIWNGKKFENFE